MTTGEAKGEAKPPPPPGDPALDQLAADWLALCRGELAALAASPELAAFWQAMLAGGAAWSAALARGLESAAAPGAPPPPPSPRPGKPPGDDRALLLARIASLEQRLAALEAGPGGSPADRPGARRRRRPA